MVKHKKVREPQNLEEALVIIRKQEAIIAKQAAKFEELEAKSLELSETVKLLMARIYGKKVKFRRQFRLRFLRTQCRKIRTALIRIL